MSAVDHFPSKEILNVVSSLKAEIESFQSGEIILKRLSPSHLRLFLGIDQEGNIINTGMRFKDELDGIKVESHPNFAARDPFIDANNHAGEVRGVVKVILTDVEANIDLLIQKYNVGEGSIEYSLTLIPGLSLEDRHLSQFLALVSSHLKQS